MKRKLYLIFLILLFSKSFSQVSEPKTFRSNGPKEMLYNILVLDEGYTSGQLLELNHDIDEFVLPIFDEITPFKEYKSFFNIYSINIFSDNSGISHPRIFCNEKNKKNKKNAKNSDPHCCLLPDMKVKNHFRTSLDDGLHSSFSTNEDDISELTGQHQIYLPSTIIIANVSTYAGTYWPRGNFSIISKDNKSINVLAHELGHSIGKLGEEYPQTGNQNPGDKCVNISLIMDANNVKWRDWIGKKGIGMNRIPNSNYYRPSNSCKMGSPDRDFCAVCTEQIILKLYEQVNIVRAFSPGARKVISRKERELTVQVQDTIIISDPTLFKLNLYKPEPNTLKISWYLNDDVIDKDIDSVYIDPEGRKGKYKLIASITDETEYLLEKKRPVYLVTWNLILNGTRDTTLFFNDTVSFFFDTDSSSAKNAKEGLFDFINRTSTTNILSIKIEGYTDSTGTETHNDSLSQKRADFIYDLLQSRRSSLKFENPIGLGVSKLFADLKRNRRVDVIIYRKVIRKI
jgi:outer membrane protein OmpA-like peptidoglycan-associated protein